ncbi:MAG: hypothetical protein H6665_16705 [Ardenticatenaceae bacterium]|nr:hypothetical protein [Ardenticatenaceae bacterium]
MSRRRSGQLGGDEGGDLVDAGELGEGDEVEAIGKGNAAAAVAAASNTACTARRVLLMPPPPVMVSRRQSGR